MRSARFPLFAAACLVAVAASGCGQGSSPYPQPPTGLVPVIAISSPDPSPPATDSTYGVSGPSLDMLVTKSMLYAAGLKHGVNPYLVMGLAWHESGWQASVVSSAGAVGIMQVMPATAAVDGPVLLHRVVNLYDPGDNIEMGTAILREHLDRYGNDIAKA